MVKKIQMKKFPGFNDGLAQTFASSELRVSGSVGLDKGITDNHRGKGQVTAVFTG